MIASDQDGWHYSMKGGKFVDLNNLFDVSGIKEVGYDEDEKCFYILTNRCKERLGLFLIKFNEKDPTKDYTFVLKIKNGLEIADADI